MSQTPMDTEPHAKAPAEARTAYALGRIRDALRGLRFGAITVTVQDGVVVQVERTEKLRLGGRERER